MIYIRADGNKAIGMGHVMRCLAVAEAVAEMDCPPLVFLTADEGCHEMIEDRGFCVFTLETDYREMLRELPQFERILDRRSDLVLVDSYHANNEYYLKLGKLARVACFEDLGEPHPVDLLINYNIYAPQLEQCYQKTFSDHYPKKALLGTSYVPLRKAFRKPACYQVRDRVTEILITTGGSDPYFAAGAIADALIKDAMIMEQGIHLHLVSGPFNQFADELKSRYRHMMQITIHEQVGNLRSLLLESDLVISATGSTIYEVSSLGVPMIVFYFAENQRQGAEALEACTEIVNAGCFAEEGSAVADRIRETVRRCIRDSDYRRRLCQQETALVDGRGAHRIAEQLRALCGRI
ncbi:MAG: UDP-2,4-diacetamido-2,4,6-trideoxy-beta-L-altropyranose hydrolase [Lachnospiraceae bacterium]|nr:UDP-2,4-diacetamido-2,4,6-trideoxy-beta-L-altropyranose hydrolase [Lachnospiraceae bacterium]